MAGCAAFLSIRLLESTWQNNQMLPNTDVAIEARQAAIAYCCQTTFEQHCTGPGEFCPSGVWQPMGHVDVVGHAHRELLTRKITRRNTARPQKIAAWQYLSVPGSCCTAIAVRTTVYSSCMVTDSLPQTALKVDGMYTLTSYAV